MRLFAAIRLPDEIQDHIAALQKELRSVHADVKWVKPGTFHLTVKFFGDVEEEKIEPLVAMLEKAVSGVGPLSLAVASLGAFPNLTTPRNIWVGVEDSRLLLPRVAETIEAAAGEAGFLREDRPFAGHITIGRIRSHVNIPVLTQRVLSLQEMAFGTFEARTIDLVRSVLEPDGPEYSCLKSIVL